MDDILLDMPLPEVSASFWDDMLSVDGLEATPLIPRTGKVIPPCDYPTLGYTVTPGSSGLYFCAKKMA
jgi:hypothetical protein